MCPRNMTAVKYSNKSTNNISTKRASKGKYENLSMTDEEAMMTNNTAK